MDEIESKEARRTRLEAEALAAEAEAEAVLTPEDAEEAALVARRQAAEARRDAGLLAKRRAEMARQADVRKKIANGAYVVETFDMEDQTPGAGLFVLRSPTLDAWKRFQDAVSAANGDNDKIVRAYNNIADAHTLWSDAPRDTDGWLAHRAKYPALVGQVGDRVGELGGAANRARKR